MHFLNGHFLIKRGFKSLESLESLGGLEGLGSLENLFSPLLF